MTTNIYNNAQDLYALFDTTFNSGKKDNVALNEIRTSLLSAGYDMQSIHALEIAYDTNKNNGKDATCKAFQTIMDERVNTKYTYGHIPSPLG